MSDNSIEKRLGDSHPISYADKLFIANMRQAAANGVGYGFMQQVTEWEWQDADTIGAWGPEYFEAEIRRLTGDLESNEASYQAQLENITGHVESLTAEVRVLRDHMRTCDADAADIELGNLTFDSGKPTYRECERCIGTGEIDCGDPSNGLIECADCEGEGKLDSKGYAPSYSARDDSSPTERGEDYMRCLPDVCESLYSWAVDWRDAIYTSNVVKGEVHGQENRDEIADLDEFIRVCKYLGLTDDDSRRDPEDDDECAHENKNFSVDGIYCEDCGETFEDNTGSNLLGGC